VGSTKGPEDGSRQTACSLNLVPLAVTFRLVLLEDSPRRYLLGALTVTSGPLCTFLDMFVFPLFLSAHTAKMFFSWHGARLSHNSRT
jgi:hypothetical protein